MKVRILMLSPIISYHSIKRYGFQCKIYFIVKKYQFIEKAAQN